MFILVLMENGSFSEQTFEGHTDVYAVGSTLGVSRES
jgi:hypothetical protein